jgi:hypothetical protein
MCAFVQGARIDTHYVRGMAEFPARCDRFGQQAQRSLQCYGVHESGMHHRRVRDEHNTTLLWPPDAYDGYVTRAWRCITSLVGEPRAGVAGRRLHALLTCP